MGKLKNVAAELPHLNHSPHYMQRLNSKTDKELLQLAAIAAGIELGEHWAPDLDVNHPHYWNPLDDDGCAMRLSVKLRLNFSQSRWYGHEGLATSVSWYVGPGESVVSVFHKESDPYAASRRAIVLAAAAIGSREQ